MKITGVISLAAIVVLFRWPAGAQIYDTNDDVAEILAGSGTAGNLNGQGTLAMFSNPSQVVADTSSNLFVFDSRNYLVREITPDGTVSTFAGGGGGALPGYGTSVSLGGVFLAGQMAIDHQNTIWLACNLPIGGVETGGLLSIGSDGYVEFLAYLTQYNGTCQNGGVCVDSGNNIYFSTVNGNQVYRLSAQGSLTLFAGSGSSGSTDANGIYASFNSPVALAADAAGNIYVWDSGNYKIRRIDQSQNVTTIAGNGSSGNADGPGLSAQFSGIGSMCVDDWGNVIMACGSSIRKMTAATNVVTMAGSFSQSSYANGAGALARFSGASGVCLSQGMVFVADQNNQRIRVISFNPQPQPVSGGNLAINTYAGLTITGLVGRTYQIQSSPNMTNWTTRATLLLNSSPCLWFDQNPVIGNKFYRAFLLP
jgi:sugar lactone lactonase YvrE